MKVDWCHLFRHIHDSFRRLPLFLIFILGMSVSFVIRTIRLARRVPYESVAAGKAVFALISLGNTAA